MKRFYLLVILFSAGLLITACSSSEELSQDSDEQSTEFQKVDAAEPIMPATDAPDRQPNTEMKSAERDVPVSVQEDPPPPVNAEVTAPAQTPPPAQVPPPAQTPPPTQATPAVQPTGTSMWSVQLGAYKNESGAFELVDEIKPKFNQPVYKTYDAVSGFYKVTLGSFKNRDDAAAFKQEIQARGYPDAFTVEVTR